MFKSEVLRYLGVLFLMSSLLCSCAGGSKVHYTVENAHSHNDYAQEAYFFAALNAGFGSMEADIFLFDQQILVAHNEKDLDTSRSLEKMYLQPLTTAIKSNDGYPYKDHQKNLQLLIDLKDANTTPEYAAATELLRGFSAIIDSKRITLTFTGNIPPDSVIAKAPEFIHFDGVPYDEHSKAAMARIYMLSDNFDKYSSWDGTGEIPKEDYAKLKAAVKLAHNQHKKIRFWNAPDNLNAWKLMKKLGVDYINTDHINELAGFLAG